MTSFLVGGVEYFLWLSIYWEELSHLTFIFFRGVAPPPSRFAWKSFPGWTQQRLQMMQSDWGDRETSDLALRNIFWVTLSCYTCLFFNTNLARKRLWGEISQPICCVLDAKTGALLAFFLPTTSQRKLYLRNPLVLVASRRSYMMNHHSATVLHDFPSHSCFQGNSLLSKNWTTKIEVEQRAQGGRDMSGPVLLATGNQKFETLQINREIVDDWPVSLLITTCKSRPADLFGGRWSVNSIEPRSLCQQVNRGSSCSISCRLPYTGVLPGMLKIHEDSKMSHSENHVGY